MFEINYFFLNKNEPITIDDIITLKSFAQSLYPYYFVNETNNKYKYEFLDCATLRSLAYSLPLKKPTQ